MIRVHFVGDGPRDGATVPYLVENILRVEIEPKAQNWRDIHLQLGKGYARKLRFSVLRAIDDRAAGLVAVVDRDKSKARSRLRELQEERDDHRKSRPSFPTALGEAAPHGEAWLLADHNAIREALRLANEVEIPSVHRTRDPKSVVESLIQQSGYRGEKITTALTDIARLVNHQRCVHGDETGFAYLVEDVCREFRDFNRNTGG